MRNLKTYEGFFDFFKKKSYEPVSVDNILDCLLPLTDNEKIKSDLTGNITDGIFTSLEKVTGSQDYTVERTDRGKFYFGENIFFFHMQYSPVGLEEHIFNIEFGAISDDEVNSIMKECQYTLEGFDCEMSFFIGRGMSEGNSWEQEFSDINKMVDKTVKKIEWSQDCIRNIIVKIKAKGGIEE